MQGITDAAVKDTNKQYKETAEKCKTLFLNKVADYGTSWRYLRPISIVDQIYIKAWRIRQIQEKKVQKVSDSISSEFIGIVNYGIIALIQNELIDDERMELDTDAATTLYESQTRMIYELMLEKNHDYGEAWREMSQESFADIILVRLQRIRQILQNEGKTIVSEGMDANFADIVNYALFALILSEENSL